MPVDGEHEAIGRAGLHEIRENFERGGEWERVDSLLLIGADAANGAFFEREADAGPGAPLNAESRKAEGAAMAGERVHVGICSRVAGLAGLAEGSGDGRKHDEEIERRIFGGAVEEPGAVSFGLHDAHEAVVA